MRKPNLFLIGAPKTGTTALAGWLATHPNVLFCTRKEPQYFSRDFRVHDRLSEADYQALFSAAGERHRYLAEGSTRYLCSEAAVPEIERWTDGARYIAMVRNPIDLVHSLHNHHVFLGVEQHKEFEVAWRLSGVRRLGGEIAANCSDPDSLAYTRMGLLGHQVQRLFETVPEHRRMVLVYDDLQRDGARLYRGVLDFLGLPDDGKRDFEAVNVSMARRSNGLSRVIDLLASVKQATGIKRSFHVLDPLLAFNRIDRPRDQISPALRDEIGAYFADDIALLSRLIGRDLSHWVETDGRERGGNGTSTLPEAMTA